MCLNNWDKVVGYFLCKYVNHDQCYGWRSNIPDCSGFYTTTRDPCLLPLLAIIIPENPNDPETKRCFRHNPCSHFCRSLYVAWLFGQQLFVSVCLAHLLLSKKWVLTSTERLPETCQTTMSKNLQTAFVASRAGPFHPDF